MNNKGSALPEWLYDENQQRKKEYARNIDNEEFLRVFNDSLEELELNLSTPVSEQPPIIFFFGLPRNGKTMFSQLLCHSLKVGYPSNFIARFWKAPTVGIKLSKILGLTSINTSFVSDIGKTDNLNEPHDFAYFWHHWFKINGKSYDYLNRKKDIDWNNFSKQLQRMSNEWRMPSVFKGVLPSYHLKEILDAYNNCYFIYLKRDYIDSALSFCKAKEKTFGDKNALFGQLPTPDVLELMNQASYSDKIALQFKNLIDIYEEQLGRIPSKNYTVLNYKEICSNPNKAIDNIIDKVFELCNYKIEKNSAPPDFFNPSIHSENDEDYAPLAMSLKNVGLPVRF